tara:strand:- start:51 stop:314 length:264 start_codon:yes stop_codon:yes gene_type:complete
MEEIHEEIKDAIKGLESFKHRYPKMETQDVIDMLKRLNENVKSNISDVSQQRELLTEYEKFASGENYINSKPLIDKQIKEFIEVNCG